MNALFQCICRVLLRSIRIKKTRSSSEESDMSLSILFSLLLPILGWAQVDPTSISLLAPSGAAKSARPVSGPAGLSTEAPKIEDNDDEMMPPVKPASVRASSFGKSKKSVASEAAGDAIPMAVIQAKQDKALNPVHEVVRAPSMAEQVEGLVKGMKLEQLEEYEEQIHPDDSRLNKVEIEAGSGLAYLDARSNSVYRSTTYASPMLFLGGKVWFTPFIGISGRYQSTLSGDEPSSNDGTARVPITQDWMDLRLNLRKYGGTSRKSNWVEYGLAYSSDETKVSSDENSRVGLKSSGFGLHASVHVPTAPTYTWTFGGALFPRNTHSEVTTGLNLDSGSSAEDTRLDLSLGGDFKMSRENVVFWDITGNFEKIQYSGL